MREIMLSHWSPKPDLGPLHNSEQRLNEPGQHRSAFEKPKGFWVSADGPDDWEEWARGNSFEIGKYRHRVYLARDANVLLVGPRGSSMAAFRNKWSAEHVWEGSSGSRYTDIYIRWEDVAKAYQGIIIAPYQWSYRMEENWYYGWDCASGCIWDVSAIAGVEPYEQEQVA